jgi:hypothetical protein
MLLASFGSALAEDDPPIRMLPQFLELVQKYPEETFRVIVTREAKNMEIKDLELEQAVLASGGKVKKQLGLIASFSADMTGKHVEKLAKHPKVRWISSDALMVSTALPGMENLRDEFASTSYAGDNDSVNWNGPWVESGENNGPGSGIIRVDNEDECASYKYLRLGQELERGFLGGLNQIGI